tara:strand:- start:1211 stop:1891 length:681 start_codon:yes stop_codon:yes gene_type:complete
MARFITGNTFGTTDNCTAALLNQAVNDAKISTDSVDGSTIELNSDALRLKDAGITTAKIADSSSKTTGVTFAKMQHISTAKVLGRSTAGEGDVEEAFDFKDEDDLGGGSSSATALASQQSIKAYVDTTAAGTSSLTTVDSQAAGYQVFASGLKMAWGSASVANGGTITFPSGVNFTVAPTVTANYNKGSNTGNYFSVAMKSVTTTDFVVVGSYGTLYDARYLAIGH